MDLPALKHRLATEGSFVCRLDRADEDTLIAFATQFGEPAFKRGRPPRPTITEVRPRPHFDPASFAGTDEFRLHTDLSWLPDAQIPRVMFLLCIRPEAVGGGASLQADGWEVLKQLTAAELTALQTVKVRMRSHRDGLGVTYRDDPLLSTRDGSLAIRFRRDLLEGEIPEVVSKFGMIADQLAQRFRLNAGEVLVMDNRRMLHGREPLKAGLDSDRFLLRIHVQ